MKMPDDLLACQQSIVAHVVDRDHRSDRSPPPLYKSQLTGRSPRLGLDTPCRHTKERLLRRIQEPRFLTVEGDAQILRLVDIDRSTDRLGTVMADVDTHRIAARPADGFQEPGLVNRKEVALGRAGLQSPPCRDAAGGNLGQVMVGLVVREPDDGPNRARSLLAPEDLGRSLDTGLQVFRLTVFNIGRLEPVFVLSDVKPGNRDPRDAGRDDLVAFGRFQEDDKPAAVFLLVGCDAVQNGPHLETARVVRWLGKDLVDPQYVKTVSILARAILDPNYPRLGHVAHCASTQASLLPLGIAGRLDEGIPGLVGDPLKTLAWLQEKQLAVHIESWIGCETRATSGSPGFPGHKGLKCSAISHGTNRFCLRQIAVRRKRTRITGPTVGVSLKTTRYVRPAKGNAALADTSSMWRKLYPIASTVQRLSSWGASNSRPAGGTSLSWCPSGAWTG